MKKGIEEYTRVSEILSIFQAYSYVEPGRLRKAQDTGTAIHAAIESYFRDEFAPLDQRRTPYFESFLKWADVFHPKPIVAETRLYDHSLEITGQFDLIASIGGTTFLLDFKTGSWAHPEIWEMQLTFYRHLLTLSDLPVPNRFMIVQLKKDGSDAAIFDYTYREECMKACMDAYSCYKWFQQTPCFKSPANLT